MLRHRNHVEPSNPSVYYEDHQRQKPAVEFYETDETNMVPSNPAVQFYENNEQYMVPSKPAAAFYLDKPAAPFNDNVEHYSHENASSPQSRDFSEEYPIYDDSQEGEPDQLPLQRINVKIPTRSNKLVIGETESEENSSVCERAVRNICARDKVRVFGTRDSPKPDSIQVETPRADPSPVPLEVHRVDTRRFSSSKDKKAVVKRIRTDGAIEPPSNRIREKSEKPPRPDPLACVRKPYSFMSQKPVEQGLLKPQKKCRKMKLRKNPGFSPNLAANKCPNSDGKFKPIFHPRLGHMVDWQHPDYFKLKKKKRKISPNVVLHCAVFANGKVGAYQEKEVKEEPTKAAKETSMKKLAAGAPRLLTKESLEYLQKD